MQSLDSEQVLFFYELDLFVGSIDLSAYITDVEAKDFRLHKNLYKNLHINMTVHLMICWFTKSLIKSLTNTYTNCLVNSIVPKF